MSNHHSRMVEAIEVARNISEGVDLHPNCLEKTRAAFLTHQPVLPAEFEERIERDYPDAVYLAMRVPTIFNEGSIVVK